MNSIVKFAGMAIVAAAIVLPVQQAQACDLSELQSKIQSFLAAVKAVDPVLYAQVEAERKASVAKFTSSVTAAWKEYLTELKARQKEYVQLLKEYIMAQFSSERAKLIAAINVKLDEVKANIKADLAKYEARVKAFEAELADKIQDLIDNLARA